MPTGWIGPPGARAPWWLLLCALVACDGRAPDWCATASGARDWAAAERSCVATSEAPQRALAHAWMTARRGDVDGALAIARPLLEGAVGDDAAYLLGYYLGRDGGGGREHLERALAGYQRSGRHRDAAGAACALWRLLGPSELDARLRVARIANDEADLSGERKPRGTAQRSLAEVYDAIGMANEAVEAFRTAEERLAPWPEELAFAYFKHGVFVLDRDERKGAERVGVEAARQFFDHAAAQMALAREAGLGSAVASLEVALHLNRADALSQLGQFEAAEHEVQVAAELDGGAVKVRMVRGFVAARRGDLAGAQAAFRDLPPDELEVDYRWRIPFELAELLKKAGRVDEAIAEYEAAIDVIEALRADVGRVELRPWVLGHRMAPYAGLLGLLAIRDDGPGGFAVLRVAESMHARAWLDTTLDRAAGPGSTDDALRDARVLARKPAPPLRSEELQVLVGDDEVLAFVSDGTQLWRIHVCHGQVTAVALEPGAEATLAAFRAAPGDIAHAQAAADLLLPAELVGDQPLLVVGRAVADLPIAALPWHGRPLVMTRPIAYLPGLAALTCPADTWDGSAVVMGNASAGPDLPLAESEAKSISAALGIKALTGAAVTRQVVLAARHADLLHLAVHGDVTNNRSALVLADGHLTAGDVLEAGLGPRVVVLTGCNTAAASDAESWGGFPSAFLASGSEFVISTIRPVEDEAAAAMAAAYYRQSDRLDPVRRLAAAQREVAATGVAIEQWSSFTAWGNARCHRR